MSKKNLVKTQQFNLTRKYFSSEKFVKTQLDFIAHQFHEKNYISSASFVNFEIFEMEWLEKFQIRERKKKK